MDFLQSRVIRRRMFNSCRLPILQQLNTSSLQTLASCKPMGTSDSIA